MVHRQHRIEPGQLGRQERGVGGQRPDQVHALVAQALQQGDDQVQLFTPQVAVFPRVRVQAKHRDARRGDAEVAVQGGVHGVQGARQPIGGEGIGHRAQRQVGGGQGHAHDVVGQHHHHLHAGLVGQQFGSATVGNAALVDHRLVHRAGYHALQFTGQAGLAGLQQRADHRAGIGRVGVAEARGDGIAHCAHTQIARLAGDGIFRQELQGQRQRRGGGVQGVRVGEGQQPALGARLLGKADAEFRTDPGGLARYQSELRDHRGNLRTAAAWWCRCRWRPRPYAG